MQWGDRVTKLNGKTKRYIHSDFTDNLIKECPGLTLSPPSPIRYATQQYPVRVVGLRRRYVVWELWSHIKLVDRCLGLSVPVFAQTSLKESITSSGPDYTSDWLKYGRAFEFKSCLTCYLLSEIQSNLSQGVPKGRPVLAALDR